MKIFKTVFAIFIASSIYGQMATHDSGANVSLMKNGVLLQKMSSQNERLIRMLDQNNKVLGRVKEVSEEELYAKKNAPNKLLVYNQMIALEEAKNRLVHKSRQLIDLCRNFKYLKQDDYSSFFTETTHVVENTISLWNQVETLMNLSSAVIPAKERQETLENAIEEIEENAKTIEKVALKLSGANKEKAIHHVLFGNN